MVDFLASNHIVVSVSHQRWFVGGKAICRIHTNTWPLRFRALHPKVMRADAHAAERHNTCISRNEVVSSAKEVRHLSTNRPNEVRNASAMQEAINKINSCSLSNQIWRNPKVTSNVIETRLAKFQLVAGHRSQHESFKKLLKQACSVVSLA